MSLHRVGSIETLADAHARRGSDASIRPRKLSFSPFPQEWDPALAPTDSKTHTQPAPGGVVAFEVPRWKRMREFRANRRHGGDHTELTVYPVQIFAAVVYCFFAAGVVFGYAAIKPILKEQGAYADTCNHSATCVEIRLNFMFTVAAVGTNVVALPVGAILDRFGPRVCGLIGSVFLFIGALILAHATEIKVIDGFMLGYLMLALGGPFTFISSFQLSNAFPTNSGLILALLTGAFDASSALFLMYRLIYQATDSSFGLKRFFLTYLAVPVVIVALQLTLMPKASYKTVGDLVDLADSADAASRAQRGPRTMDDQVDEHTALLQEEGIESWQHPESVVADVESILGSATGEPQLEAEERKNTASGVWGIMHENTVLEQLKSPWWILICLFTVVQMTRINYFVATIRPQFEAFFGAAKAAEINTFFDIALPVGGLLSIPFIGITLDHTSTTVVLTTLVSVATVIGFLGVLPYEWSAYLNIILFVLYRPFYYTAVSDYSAKVFGFRTFGTVYGLIICLSGLLNLSQSGLDVLFHTTFDGNPVPVNLMLLFAGLVVGVALVLFVTIQVRKRRSV